MLEKTNKQTDKEKKRKKQNKTQQKNLKDLVTQEVHGLLVPTGKRHIHDDDIRDC